MRIVGIDPGQNGGIAWCNDGFMQVWPMPSTERDISSLLFDMAFPDETFCLIEKVHSMTGQGVKSMFTFGQHYGFLRGLLVAHRIPFEEVPPKTWQMSFGIKGGTGVSKTLHKNRLKQKAQNLFPDMRVTLKTCDALLIAEYGRRLYERQQATKKR